MAVLPGDLGIAGGDLGMAVNIPLDESRDKYDPGEKSGSRPSIKLDLGGRPEKEVWAAMVEEGERIREAGFEYDTFSGRKTNSNSVTRTLLNNSGITFEGALPPGITVEDLPGIETDLWSDPEPDDPEPDDPEWDNSDLPLPSTMKEKDRLGRRGRTLLQEIQKPGAPHEEALAKPVSDWSEDDARAVMTARITKPATDAERDVMAAQERKYFLHFYGDGPARRDATGRLMSPEPIRPLPEPEDLTGKKRSRPCRQYPGNRFAGGTCGRP